MSEEKPEIVDLNEVIYKKSVKESEELSKKSQDDKTKSEK